MSERDRSALSLEKRSRERAVRIVGHRARSFAEADRWDLEFWQSLTPAERLSTLVSLRRDAETLDRDRSIADADER
jgi:hypothetical protein